MNEKRLLKFKLVDILLIMLMILPFLCGIVLKVLTTPASEGIEISGARIFISIPFPIQPLVITEAQINSWLVILSLLSLCLYLTHGIKSGTNCKRHLIACWIVEKIDSLIESNMGPYFAKFAPFICATLALSAFSSLTSLLGLYPPTSDVNVVFGWSLLVFVIITHYKLKGGVWNYVKGFGEPIIVFAPFNIIGELSTPISMAFRHYGNVLSGVVVSTLVASALQGLSSLLLGRLGSIPFLKIGIPAVLSVYFDIFSGCLQAFIFAMLTMMYISGGFPEELWRARIEKRKNRKTAHTAAKAKSR